jgi:hypothetical protein
MPDPLGPSKGIILAIAISIPIDLAVAYLVYRLTK